jgi:hypothetical protein
MTDTLVIRPIRDRWKTDLAIRFKDGSLVVTDHLARRSCFDLSRPDGPRKVFGYFLAGSRVGGSTECWAILDGAGRSFLEVDKRQWNPDDFVKLAQVAGLALEPADGFPTSTHIPDRRSDYVELGGFSGGYVKELGVISFLVPVLVCVGIAGLIAGFPWFWPVLWLALGVWAISESVQNSLSVQRNRPHLPVDEGGLGLPPDKAGPQPSLQLALRERNAWRRAAIWGAVAILPPLFVSLR